MIDVIVVGAGWTGLVAAARLAASGRSVAVVEKSRGAGGRCATRREQGFFFDHGAQYLTARSEAFERQVRAWAHSGLLETWRPEPTVFGPPRPGSAAGRPRQRWVGVGGMNAVPRQLAHGLDCRWQWHATELIFDHGCWQVRSARGESLLGRSLLLTAPAPQCADLLGPEHALTGVLRGVEMLPCWALMLGFERPVDCGFDAAFVNQGPLAWLARGSAAIDGGSRAYGESWVAHASTSWSFDHLERDASSAASALHSAAAEVAPALGREPQLCTAHRWRYARARRALDGPILRDDGTSLVVAGDWCAGERIEGAWISGVAAARHLSKY